MKRNTFINLIGFAFIGLTVTACGGGVPSGHKPPKDTADLDMSKVVINYGTGEGEEDFIPSSGFGNGAPFNVTWNADNAVVEDNELHLKITDATSGEYPYFGGEMRSLDFYGYGDYGVKMKPGKTVGTASTFFLYTGEWDSEELHPSTGEYDTRNPDNLEGKHDEIDIEFLGKSTNKVQFNYFTNGKGGNEYMYDLGFDASEAWHTYGFRWEKDRITWFVDGKPVYTATKNIPTHPGRILTNYWCGAGDIAGWMGKFENKDTDTAKYQWISASGDRKHSNKEADPVTPGGEGTDWSKIEAVDFTDLQGNTDVYTTKISEDKKSVDVTYTDVGQTWQNINFAIPAEVKDARELSFKVENKGTEAVAVRGNANAAATHGEHNIYAVNSSAKQDGVAVTTDLEWGGSMFVIAPGATSLCEIKYTEALNRLEFMIDSHIAGNQSGHVVLSDLKFAASSSGPVDPVEPTQVSLDFSGSGYECSTKDGVSTITYESIDDNSYANVVANLGGKAPEGANTLEFDFENKGAEKVQINVDIRISGETSYFVERSDIKYDWYDTGAHRVQYNINAGESRHLAFAYDAPSLPQILLIFINSAWAETEVTHTNGNMTISNVTFSTVVL